MCACLAPIRHDRLSDLNRARSGADTGAGGRRPAPCSTRARNSRCRCNPAHPLMAIARWTGADRVGRAGPLGSCSASSLCGARRDVGCYSANIAGRANKCGMANREIGFCRRILRAISGRFVPCGSRRGIGLRSRRLVAWLRIARDAGRNGPATRPRRQDFAERR